MSWRKSCEAHKFFTECFWRKMPRTGNKRGWHCASNHYVNLSNADSEQVFVKNIGQKLYFPSWEYIQTCLKLNKKGAWTAGGVHGYLSWWLRTSLWQHDRTQIAKLIKDWPKQRKVVSQSFYVSSGVAFSGNNDLSKILLFCERFRLRQIRW